MTIEKSPEIKDSAAMFGGILRQAAMKTIPKIDEITQKIQQSLPESQLVSTLNENIPFLEKALTSYETDIQKAQDTGNEYYLKLVGDLSAIKDDLDLIKTATIYEKNSITGDNIYPYIMDKNEYHDIDTEDDWKRAENV